jgi:hypothetical protein
MLLVAPVRDDRRVPLSADDTERLRTDPDLFRRVNIVRSQVPAITHVDYSARVQTVDERHGRFRRLMHAFHGKTGCPVIVNTSFNLSWEPIVESPQQAYNTFLQSNMDVLVLEDYVLHKADQPGRAASPGRNGRAAAAKDFTVDSWLPEQGPALTNRLLREFAALWILFCGGFAYLSYTRDHLIAAAVLAVLACAVGPMGLVRPPLIRPLFVGLTAVTRPIGWAVSQVLLAVMFYGVFTPFGFALRLGGRDVLWRRRRGLDSYWTPKPVPEDVTSYFRQS